MYNERLLATAILKQAKDDYISMRRNWTKANRYLYLIKKGKKVPKAVNETVCRNKITEYEAQRQYWIHDAHIWLEYLDIYFTSEDIMKYLKEWDNIARNHHFQKEGIWVYI